MVQRYSSADSSIPRKMPPSCINDIDVAHGVMGRLNGVSRFPGSAATDQQENQDNEGHNLPDVVTVED